jgi:hypothetical protein
VLITREAVSFNQLENHVDLLHFLRKSQRMTATTLTITDKYPMTNLARGVFTQSEGTLDQGSPVLHLFI